MLARGFGSGGDGEIRQAVQIGRAVQRQLEGLFVRQHILAEARGQRGQSLLDLADARFGCCIQRRA